FRGGVGIGGAGGVIDGDVGARMGEGDRDPPADSGARAGDERLLTLQQLENRTDGWGGLGKSGLAQVLPPQAPEQLLGFVGRARGAAGGRRVAGSCIGPDVHGPIGDLIRASRNCRPGGVPDAVPRSRVSQPQAVPKCSEARTPAGAVAGGDRGSPPGGIDGGRSVTLIRSLIRPGVVRPALSNSAIPNACNPRR